MRGWIAGLALGAAGLATAASAQGRPPVPQLPADAVAGRMPLPQIPVESAIGTWKRFDGRAIAGELAPAFQGDGAHCFAEAIKATANVYPPDVVAKVQMSGRSDPFAVGLKDLQMQAIGSLLRATGTNCMMGRGYYLVSR